MDHGHQDPRLLSLPYYFQCVVSSPSPPGLVEHQPRIHTPGGKTSPSHLRQLFKKIYIYITDYAI